MMGNRRLYKIECFHMVAMSESERLKVTALNLFHPTASPPCVKVSFLILRHNLLRERVRVRGFTVLLIEGYLEFGTCDLKFIIHSRS